MRETFMTFAKYSKRANESVLDLVGNLPLARRDEDRKSYYHSLYGLIDHIFDGTLYFLRLFKASLPEAERLLAGLPAYAKPEGALTDAAWEDLKRAFAAADGAAIGLVEGLSEADMSKPVKLDWFAGRETVPFSFVFNSLIIHGIHHRGHVSQILDEMGIEHDFSGLDEALI